MIQDADQQCILLYPTNRMADIHAMHDINPQSMSPTNSDRHNLEGLTELLQQYSTFINSTRYSQDM